MHRFRANAILLMVAAMASFVINDTLVKVTGGLMPTGQIVALRGLVATLIIATICWSQGQLGHVRHIAHPAVLIRASLDMLGTLCFISALLHMPIGNLTAIHQTVPLVVTGIAALFLGERVGWRRCLAIVVGLIGVCLVIKPDPSDVSRWELLAIACVLCVAVRDLVTRRIAPGVPSLVIALANAGFVATGGGLLWLIQGGAPFGAREALLLTSAGGALAAGYIFMILTLRAGDLSATAPARYSTVVFAILSGTLVFGEIPDLYAIAGIVLIIAAGFYAIHREARLRRLAAAAAE